ncbi:NAD(P)H-dependent oxidoreductase, partial [Romboutsia ilealis]|uniref:NAD(P)H-dependent oxidoreductase n=2 Tax=Clostridia TaxID=186801 RepID=UPI00272B557D
MNLLIISCTPRIKEKSNTDKILDEFKKGYESYGNTTETLYLYKRNEWETIRKKFYENDNILFALPLYVECIPGIMAEFLESLKPKHKNNTKIGFLLQGGFGEASQLRCCESYLETLPSLLGCEYNGTLLKGNMFAVSFMDGKIRKKMVEPFYNMGKYYAQNNYFNKACKEKVKQKFVNFENFI